MVRLHWIIAGFLATTGLPALAAEPARIAIVGATLIDGNGGPPLVDSTILVIDGRIDKVGKRRELRVPAGSTVVNVKGKFVVPGIVDAHTHVDSLGVAPMTDEEKTMAREYYPRAFLFHGVTSVVNMSAHVPAEVLAMRDRANTDPTALLPRIYTGASHFTADKGRGGRHNGGIKNAAEIQTRLDDIGARGFDLVKIIDEDGLGDEVVFPKIDSAYLLKVVEVSTQKNLPVFIHATDADEYREAIAVGPRAIAHGLFTPIAADSDIIAGLKRKGMFVVPTAVLFESFYDFIDHPKRLDDPLLAASVPDFIMRSVRNPATEAEMNQRMNSVLKMDGAQWSRSAMPALLANMKIMAAAGVKMAIGTDSGGGVMHAFQGYNTPREMEIFAECCMTPMQTIVAATKTGAEIIGKSDLFGTVEPGKSADLLILNADPLRDMHSIRDFDRLMLRGRIIERSALSYASYLKTRNVKPVK